MPSGFLSPPSARRATLTGDDISEVTFISIPALREEGDPAAHLRLRRWRYFYPRPPRGGRPTIFLTWSPTSTFLSPPSARRATRNHAGGNHDKRISIPALREEGDTPRGCPTAGGDLFLSPPSARRATCGAQGPVAVHRISIPALREEGDTVVVGADDLKRQFLSPPSARRATEHQTALQVLNQFLSPPSARRATEQRLLVLDGLDISIPALREEGDLFGLILV